MKKTNKLGGINKKKPPLKTTKDVSYPSQKAKKVPIQCACSGTGNADDMQKH